MPCNGIKCFQRRSYPKQGKKLKKIGIKSFYSNTSYDLKYEKAASVNYLLSFHKKFQSSKDLYLPNASEF